MYLTQKNQISNLTEVEYTALRELCKLSKNLYNVALYSIRQSYFTEKKYLRYEANYHVCKNNENYQLLNTDIAQQVLKVVDRNCKSFFSLMAKAKQENCRLQSLRLPRYLYRSDYFSLIIPRIKVKSGYFAVPMSAEFKKQFGEIKIPFPERLQTKTVKEVRIHPKYDAQFFEVEFVYLQEEEQPSLDPTKAIAIDFGMDNLATGVTNSGSSILVDGRRLQSIHHWYEKENARLQAVKIKQGISVITKKQVKLIVNLTYQINDYLNKAARRIVAFCLENQIGNMLINTISTEQPELGVDKQKDQKFCRMLHDKLRLKLQAHCKRYGVNCFAPAELDNLDTDNSLNIFSESNLIDLAVLKDNGCLAPPLRIRVI